MFRKINGLEQNVSIICTIPYISENTLKYDISDSKENTYRGVPLQQTWMLQANDFTKKFTLTIFF